MSFSLTTLAFLLVAPSLMAQETTSTILGSIKDANGKPIAGATVSLLGAQMLGERKLVTGADGSYRIPLLPAGPYTVSVYAKDYIGTKATFYLNAGATLRQDLALKLIQQTGATVEIVASAAQLDKTETATKTSMSTEQLEAITGTPVSGGSIAYNVLAVAPGVVGAVQYASVRGGGQMATNYLVNGVSSRDNVTGQARLGDTVLDDTIEDTSIIQSPLNAKLGGTSSGLVSVVTKRGSNEFSGSIRAKLSNAGWNAVPTAFRNRLGSTPTTDPHQGDDLNRVWELTLGGPIIKDKLTFFYGSRIKPQVAEFATAFNPAEYGADTVRYNGVNYPSAMFQANQLQSAVAKSSFHQFELFYQITPNHSLEANYTEAPEVASDLQYNNVTPDASIMGVQTTDKRLLSLAYHGIIGTNQILEIRYGKNRSYTQFASGPKVPVILMAGPSTMTDLNGVWDGVNDAYNNSPMGIVGWITEGAGADTQPDKRTTESFFANYSILVDWKGTHAIDVGIERQQPIWGTVSKNNSYPDQFTVPGRIDPSVGGGLGGKYIVFPFGSTIDGYTYNDPNDPYVQGLVPSYQRIFGADQADVKNPTDSFYINDLWTLNNNWSVMAGLRYDRMQLKDAAGTKVDSKMISPRFELKWDINGDQKRLVNLSYGQFRGLFNARFYRTAVEGRRNNQETYQWTTGTGMQLVDYADVINPANYGLLTSFVTGAMYDIDKGWKPECNTEITLGYRRTFDTGGFWRATIVHRKWTDLTNVFPDLSKDLVLQDGPLTLHSYKRTLTNDKDSKREYNGLEFEFSAPITANLLFGGNFVYSSLVGDNVYGDGTGFASSAQVWAEQGNFRYRYQQLGYDKNMFEPVGPLAQSRPVVAKAFLTYHLEAGRTKSSVSLSADFISGTRVNLTNRLNQDPNLLIPDPVNAPAGVGADDTNHPTYIPLFWNGRGQFSQPDTWHLNLAYNVDLAIKGKLHIFSSISVNNLLNSLIPLSVTQAGSTTNRAAASYATGYRTGSYSGYGTPSGTAAVTGLRSINLDLGLKF
jgi:hypothetical protein